MFARLVKLMFQFEIYTYNIGISCEHLPMALEKIQNDFSFFKTSSLGSLPQLTILTHPLSLATLKFGLPLWKTRMCTVIQNTWNDRTCLYKLNGKIAAVLKHQDHIASKKIDIYCDNEALFCEIVHMLILSSCGEYLEQKSIMRLHAAVLTSKDTSFVFWGGRGAGKSTLIYHLMSESEVKILTDEHGLLDLNTRELLPFPLRIALDSMQSQTKRLKRFYLDQKYTLDIPQDKQGDVSYLNNFIMLHQRRGSDSKLQSLTWPQKSYLFIHIILGLGLIQMSEFLLRPTAVAPLFKILRNRFKLFLTVINSNILYWDRSTHIETNMTLCQDLLRSNNICERN